MRQIITTVLLVGICAGHIIAQQEESQEMLDQANRWYESERYSVAGELYKKLAREGNAEAQRKLGIIYLNGLGTKKNFPKAIKLLKSAAVQGDVEAMTSLGDYYMEQNDFENALKNYQTGAMRGDPNAMYKVGIIYYDGKGVSPNYKLAMDWFLKASENNHAQAEWQLGIMYTRGAGVEADYQEGLKWFEKSCEHGWSAACIRVEKGEKN